ncbi:hypothetical protein [Helicobacter bilis]|uniref:hypothetical protein n=1 Tax=Helicobacter bilis TaxID=37372 RepID=UPI00248F44AC|nr:hypothetical protein [Helicobacter bilis]
MPIPLLESDKLECIHKGKVLLQSSISNLLSINNAGAITLQDLSQANIIGCQNQILGVPAPCTKLIISTPESITSTLLEVNKEKIVLTEYINQVLTDKGSPLSLQESPKAKGLCEIEQTLDSNNPHNTSTESSTAINATNTNTNNTIDSNMQDNVTENNTNSQQTKQIQEKQILEMYYSYGENKQKLDSISKHTDDINLHIITQGYENGEIMDLTLEFQGESFQTSATIQDNQVIIINILNKV